MRKEQKFVLKSDYQPAGDQPEAISALVKGLRKGYQKQTLLGVTGSGKTFTVANIIEQMQKPTLVVAHNKTLAAQLAQEYREFFPDAAVHYFVSYYDYYQPEAYVAVTDTYIEKDASINEEIDRLRHATTQALLTRTDVIIVASVSCLYGLGAPEEYAEQHMMTSVGDSFGRREFMEKLISIYYERTNADLKPGQFRALGSNVEVMPISETIVYRFQFVGGSIGSISKINPVTSEFVDQPEVAFIFPAKHFVTDKDKRERALESIQLELSGHLKKLKREGKILEAERLKRRTTYDIAMIREVGYTSGIENYSRHMSGKAAGEAPETLLSYFPKKEDGSPDFLTVIDESHVTLPQMKAMYAGDQARKKTLVEFGFRLPSALDNRPLQHQEFEERVNQMLFVSATPSDTERTDSQQIVQQIIRPTGLVDPMLEVRSVTPEVKEEGAYPGQVQDFISESIAEVKKGGRVLATTLTKKMAEDLTEYLKSKDLKTEYIHSDVKTIDRIKIITDFRKGTFDCLVGVNLLREGLDMPEVTLIGILDADKEGFLRSETSLIQTIGRAARNEKGRVVLYADRITGSMERAMGETQRRRDIQLAYNKKHGITPKTIQKKIQDITEHMESSHDKAVKASLMLDQAMLKSNPKKLIKQKRSEMEGAVRELDFETAAILRDEIRAIEASLEVK